MERNAGTKGRAEGTYAYSPYGELEEGYKGSGTPFLFQDDYLDPQTLLYLMQARWYDPSTSTLLSQDPEMGEAQDPQLRLPYTYCAGDPVNNSDPSGKTAKDLALAMQKPVLARLIARNPSLMLFFLLKPAAGKKTSFLGGLFANKNRAENRANQSAKSPSPWLGNIVPGVFSESIEIKEPDEHLLENMSPEERAGYNIMMENVGRNEIIDPPEEFRNSTNPFLRYIYYDQKARAAALRYQDYRQSVSDREFTNVLAGTMAYVLLEVGPTNLDPLNQLIDAFGVSEKVTEQLSRNFSNLEKERQLKGEWQQAHELRLQALNEVEAQGYHIQGRFLVHKDIVRTEEYPRTKDYWIGLNYGSPTSVLGEVSMLPRTTQLFPGPRSWHNKIGWLEETEYAPLERGKYDFNYNF